MEIIDTAVVDVERFLRNNFLLKLWSKNYEMKYEISFVQGQTKFTQFITWNVENRRF